jgi:hypothetical protein
MMPWLPINATGESFLPSPDSIPHPESKSCIKVLQRIKKSQKDDLVQSPKVPYFVIPAEAGIQVFHGIIQFLDFGFHRSDELKGMYQ